MVLINFDQYPILQLFVKLTTKSEKIDSPYCLSMQKSVNWSFPMKLGSLAAANGSSPLFG